MLVAAVAAGLSAVASCRFLRGLTVGSFNLVRPVLGRQDLRLLEHLSFGGGFANKGLHLLFPLLDLRSLHITVRLGTVGTWGTSSRCFVLSSTCHKQQLCCWCLLLHAQTRHSCKGCSAMCNVETLGVASSLAWWCAAHNDVLRMLPACHACLVSCRAWTV
jgi:hypothetical protein